MKRKLYQRKRSSFLKKIRGFGDITLIVGRTGGKRRDEKSIDRTGKESGRGVSNRYSHSFCSICSHGVVTYWICG